MKKYKNIIIIGVILLAVVVATLLYFKEKAQKNVEDILNFDFDGDSAKRGQRVKLVDTDNLMKVSVNAGKVTAFGSVEVSKNVKLIYVGKYNSTYIVKKPGWFFDTYFLAQKHQLV